jgi:hypothetical protein
MASIENYISDLLCLHDCVIVPGLGGFVANYKSAVIVDERNLFQPPTKEIGFNPSLSHNDGLLANHVGKREQKNWDDSIALINDFVASLNDRINNGETVRFERLGTFRKDSLGSFQFSPNERNKLRSDAFGLDEFHFEPLQHANLAQKHEEPVRRLLRSRSPKYWTSVAAMVAGLLLFSPELKMPEHQQIDTSNMFPAVSSVVDQNTVAPTETEIVEKTNEAEISDEKVIAQEEATDAPGQIKIKSPYHLIAASFKYETPAKNALKQFLKNGFPEAQIIKNKNGRHRIALFSFVERKQAIEKLNFLREDDQYQNIWLLEDAD